MGRKSAERSETEKFYTELAKSVRKRLGITDEDAGIFTQSQRRLILMLAEGRTLWSVESRRVRDDWEFKFKFHTQRVTNSKKEVLLSSDEMVHLRHHLDFFSKVGLCALSPDLLHTLELDLAYEEIQKARKMGTINPEIFL